MAAARHRNAMDISRLQVARMTDLKQILSEAAQLADRLDANLIDDIHLELDEDGVLVKTVDPYENPAAYRRSTLVAWELIERDSTALASKVLDEAERQARQYGLPRSTDTTPHTSDFGTTQIKTEGSDSA